MGLIYVSGESNSLINGLKANITSGKATLEQLNSGSQQLISSVDGNALAGAAYTAAKGLFSELIIPTVSRITAAIDDLESELQTYRSAHDIVSGEGKLDEDKLTQQIATKKAMKIAVDSSIAVTKSLAKSNPASNVLDSLLNVQSRLGSMSNEYADNIRELEEKLEKLRQFSSSTSGLFSTSLTAMKLAMQSVTVLSNTLVKSDGTYVLPLGTDKSWFIENKESSQTEFNKLKNKVKDKDLPATKADIIRDYHWSTSSNMYVHNKTGLPSPEVTALYNKLVIAEHQPQKNPELEFYNEMLRTGKHPITGEVASDAEKLNAKIMMYALALQPFVGAWAMSQVPKSYQPSTAKKSRGTNQKVISDLESPVLDGRRVESGAKVDDVKPVWGKDSKGKPVIEKEFPQVAKEHGFPDIIDNYPTSANEYPLIGGDGIDRKFFQLKGSNNGKSGVFEWIVEPNGDISHRRFIDGGVLTGKPNQIPKK